MKITVSQLRRIIKEEVSRALNESEQSLYRDDGKIYLIDDEGNKEFLENVEGSDYEDQLPFDGASIPFSGGHSSMRGSRSSYGRSSYGRRRY